MINKDRVLKLLQDVKEWQRDFAVCLESLEMCGDEKLEKVINHSIRAYFLDIHILFEDYISIQLKILNRYKVDISAVEGMEIIMNERIISEEFFSFYSYSRRLRNRLAHRYKMPTDDVLLDNLRNNGKYINELEEAIKNMI